MAPPASPDPSGQPDPSGPPAAASAPSPEPAVAPDPGAAPGSGGPPPGGATYAAAGVDIAAGDAAVDRIRDLVASTARPGVLGAIGGFGGLFELDTTRYRRPVLVASTDGVGTKAVVARAAGRLDTVGIDLVAMCVDDLVCQGAEPLFLLDYVATGKVDPDRMAELVSGVAEGCRQAGCALLGGEMAEHAGVMEPGEFDLAGFAVGVVDAERLIGPERVVPGDVLVGLPSPGLRSNGYTLARHVLLDVAGLAIEDPCWEGADVTVADELLRPSVVYAGAVVAALGAHDVHAVAHITGGGIPGNLNRALPPACDAVLRRGSWSEPRIFTEIARLGNVAEGEMDRVFNRGIGMVLVVPAGEADGVVATLAANGRGGARVIGTVAEGTGAVRYEEG